MANEERDEKRRAFWRVLPAKAAAVAPEGGNGLESPNGLTPMEPPREPMARRRFLGLMGASAALAATAACQAPEGDTIVPYTKKPSEVIPGVANYYASTVQEGLVPYGVLVKTREGRPIHIDGNDEHPLFEGKTSPRIMAEVIGLYDPDRLRQPAMDGRPADWAAVDGRVVPALKAAASGGKAVLLVTPAVISPSQRALLQDLKAVLPTLRHVAWEPAADHAGRAAARALFGEVLCPRYHLEKAKVIVTLEADLLGTMDQAVPAIRGFAANRRLSSPAEPMNRLYALEGTLTLTGTKADHRLPMRPSAAAAVAFALALELHERHHLALPDGLAATTLAPFALKEVARAQGLELQLLEVMAEDLAKAGPAALVVAGPSLPYEAHAAASLLNTMLGAEGSTVDASFAPPPVQLAAPEDMATLAKDLASGVYAAAIVWGANPAYDHPGAETFVQSLSRVPLRVRLGLREDETAKCCQVVLPVNHWMESWGDFEAGTDLLSLQQPLIRPLYQTRQAEEILLRWAKALGAPVETDYRLYVMGRWRREVFPAASPVPFEAFWNAAVHDGVLRLDVEPRAPRQPKGAALAEAMDRAKVPAGQGMDLVLARDLKLWDGRYANIGWLQELPDPVTDLTWGCAALISAADAQRLTVQDGDLLRIEAGGKSLEVPALIQPGQARGVVTLPLGYGRTEGRVASGIGINAFPFVASGGSPFLRTDAAVIPTGGHRELYRTQKHFSLEGRDIVRLWDLDEYKRQAAHPQSEQEVSLYEGHPYTGEKWGMAIDMSACVGCSGCVIACQSENNIPVVGPEQVARGREMQWIRIDKYYEGDAGNPKVVHQPMLCQQCDDAPCENVCPVAATTHSPDGLNQMVYNRCVGTRYCSNNCPYKVRRFNFLDYTSFIKDPLDLAFNPEVTVRPRGVMEKCTFCVQRIVNGRRVAADEHRPLRDGEIVPACQAACPASAIVFGDLNDKSSRVAGLSRSDRRFKVLEELGTRPAITYMAELKNPAVPGEDKDA